MPATSLAPTASRCPCNRRSRSPSITTGPCFTSSAIGPATRDVALARAAEEKGLTLSGARIKALNDERVANLHRSGELLRLAADVRSLVAQLRSTSSVRDRVDRATLAEWSAWALEEADRIDPVLSGQFLSHMHPPVPDGD